MEKKSSESLHITFHNPNTPEETARYLVKVIAANITERVIENKYRNKCG